MSRRNHAVVIGGSIAGLLAARVLADRFERVTILDRDQLPDRPEPRKGAPQSYHVHVLLRRGLTIMEQLFPGLDTELAEAGAPRINWTSDLVYFTPAGWGPRFPSDSVTHACSRGLLEYVIRCRVAALRNVTLESRCEALDLTVNDDHSIVTGVKAHYRDRTETAPATLTADLVVDASGRSSRSLEWLSALGYAAPDETVIDAHLGYATRLYQRPARFNADWAAMIVRTRPPYGLKGGLIYPIENNWWMVNLGGAGKERPPTDEAGFLAFTRTFIHPAFYEALREAEPLSPVYTYQLTANRLRHFERLARWPEHWVVLGDAACALNPIYGQGMSVAANEALTLAAWLDSSHTSLWFQQRLLQAARAAWLLATSEDVRLPDVSVATNGHPGTTSSRFDALLRNYIDQVVWLTAADPHTFETFMRVTHLIRPASDLLHPRIALKVLRRLLRHEQPHGQPGDPIPPAPRTSLVA
jgi:2-polyprenyl-6-methoxyphenol hydroxylase-like FAD-dependent oxidoreductase